MDNRKIENQNLLLRFSNFSVPEIEFRKNGSGGKSKEILDKYKIKDMNDWTEIGADLIITDPPFGIKFSGKNGNYNRKVGRP